MSKGNKTHHYSSTVQYNDCIAYILYIFNIYLTTTYLLFLEAVLPKHESYIHL